MRDCITCVKRKTFLCPDGNLCYHLKSKPSWVQNPKNKEETKNATK